MLTVLNSSHDPFYNQAFEEYVFEHFREGEIFLLWQNDPAVIVGSYQNICREVHVERLRQLGIPVIRRITGGGTVYHDLGNLRPVPGTYPGGAERHRRSGPEKPDL